MNVAEVMQGSESEVIGGTIRPARTSDLPKIQEYGQKFHEQSQQPFPFNAEAAERFARIMIENEDAQIFISDTGMIGGVLTPAYVAPNWVMAVELFWWADGGGLKLLYAFENWAKEMGAREIRMTSLAALERADGLLRGLSYAPAEISYRKLIQWQ